MSRLVRFFVSAVLIASVAGCCASPYRIYQSAYGFNNPRPERYNPGPPPPRITPPGPSMPAVISSFSSTSSS